MSGPASLLCWLLCCCCFVNKSFFSLRSLRKRGLWVCCVAGCYVCVGAFVCFGGGGTLANTFLAQKTFSWTCVFCFHIFPGKLRRSPRFSPTPFPKKKLSGHKSHVRRRARVRLCHVLHIHTRVIVCCHAHPLTHVHTECHLYFECGCGCGCVCAVGGTRVGWMCVHAPPTARHVLSCSCVRVS